MTTRSRHGPPVGSLGSCRCRPTSRWPAGAREDHGVLGRAGRPLTHHELLANTSPVGFGFDVSSQCEVGNPCSGISSSRAAGGTAAGASFTAASRVAVASASVPWLRECHRGRSGPAPAMMAPMSLSDSEFRPRNHRASGCPERMNRGVPAAGWIRDCCDIACSPFHSPGNMSLVASTSGRVCSCWDRQRWKPLLPAAELIHCSPGVVADLTSQVPAGLSTGSGTLYPRTVDSPDSPPIPPCRAAPVLSHLGDCRCRTAVTRPGGYRFCSPMRTVTSPSRVWPRIRITR